MTSRKSVVAITGASGFIGRRLVAEHISSGDTVRVLSRKPCAPHQTENNLSTFVGDLAAGNIPYAFLEGADIVYHCAAELRDPAGFISINVAGTDRLLSLAAGRVGRWVQLSTCGVYGPRSDGTVSEDAEELPANAYELSKSRADFLVRESGERLGMHFVILRPTNVFGPGMPGSYLLKLRTHLRRGYWFAIGPPGAIMNCTHVDNVVAALKLCGLHSQATGRTYILSESVEWEYLVEMLTRSLNGNPRCIRISLKLAEGLSRLLGQSRLNPLSPERLQMLASRARYSSDRIVAELGYRPKVSLEEGLTATVRELESHV